MAPRRRAMESRRRATAPLSNARERAQRGRQPCAEHGGDRAAEAGREMVVIGEDDHAVTDHTTRPGRADLVVHVDEAHRQPACGVGLRGDRGARQRLIAIVRALLGEEEVALLSSKDDYNATDEEKMYRSMREKAGEMGANTIILQSVQEPGTGSKVAHALIGISANREGKALAVSSYPTAPISLEGRAKRERTEEEGSLA
jgi:hypothetical protein